MVRNGRRIIYNTRLGPSPSDQVTFTKVSAGRMAVDRSGAVDPRGPQRDGFRALRPRLVARFA